MGECAEAVLNVEGKTVSQIFGYPDYLKLKSSMTLFSEVTTDLIFARVLNKYFQDEQNEKTIQLLNKLEK